MNKVTKLAAVSALALLVAAPAMAQGALIGINGIDDQITDIERAANKDLARGNDTQRFGPMGVVQGFRGSFALTGSAATGNSDTTEVALGGRINYGMGEWNHSFGIAANYGEASSVKNEEKFFGIYEGSRYFTPEFYMYGVGRYQYDGFSTNRHDAFLGFGPGYRIINTPTVAWRVQGGPGVRYVKQTGVTPTTEAAFLASSRVFYALTDTVSLTNDTDFLGSDVNKIVTNDFGLNFKVSNNLSTRISYRTDYNSDPAVGKTATDNTLGVSLIVGF